MIRRKNSRFVNAAHEVWRATHGSSFARKGVVLLLLVRCATFSAGCGPKDGSIGGKCRDDGCHTYCDVGSCDNQSDTCVAPGSGTGTPAVVCEEVPNPSCGERLGFRCPPDAAPNVYASTCDVSSSDADGGTSYCCDDPERGTCATDDAAPCPGPSSSYQCTGYASPDASTSTDCFMLNASTSSAHFCCAPHDTCFPALPENPDYGPCGNALHIYCTGDAVPPGNCLLARADENVTFYCCDDATDAGRD